MSVGAVNKQTGERIPTAGMPAIDSILSGSSTNPVQNRVVKAAFDEKANTDIVASDFSAAASYTAGDYCIYEGKFYKFKANHSGAWAAADVDEIKIAGELSSLRSGLTKQVSNSITLPATSNGITTVQIETSAPSGANIIGGCISNVSSYSDSVAIGVYYYGNYARVTCVSPVETTLPSITLNLITTYTV